MRCLWGICVNLMLALATVPSAASTIPQSHALTDCYNSRQELRQQIKTEKVYWETLNDKKCYHVHSTSLKKLTENEEAKKLVKDTFVKTLESDPTVFFVGGKGFPRQQFMPYNSTGKHISDGYMMPDVRTSSQDAFTTKELPTYQTIY